MAHTLLLNTSITPSQKFLVGCSASKEASTLTEGFCTLIGVFVLIHSSSWIDIVVLSQIPSRGRESFVVEPIVHHNPPVIHKALFYQQINDGLILFNIVAISLHNKHIHGGGFPVKCLKDFQFSLLDIQGPKINVGDAQLGQYAAQWEARDYCCLGSGMNLLKLPLECIRHELNYSPDAGCIYEMDILKSITGCCIDTDVIRPVVDHSRVHGRVRLYEQPSPAHSLL